MRSMCTSRRALAGSEWAFTAIELLIGICIAASLAIAMAPVWLSWERVGDGETDQTIWFMQSRVALARFERDLRQASAVRCPFPTVTSVLEATPSQLVVLARTNDGAPPVLVEWEIVRGSVMRRWGRCPETRPAVFAHSSYLDSKTMLEGVRAGSGFAYCAGARRLEAPVDPSQLDSVTSVALELVGGVVGAQGDVSAGCTGQVGR